MSWHAVDGDGLALATGRPPQPPGAPSPAAALAAAPVATWPLTAVADDGRRVDVATALGTGGSRVAVLLERIATGALPPEDLDLATLASATPGGRVAFPVAMLSLFEASDAAGWVDEVWLTTVDQRRSAPRGVLVEAGRATELEAALHLTMLLATRPLDGDCPWQARVASGAKLWLLGGAVAWALLGADPDPDPVGDGPDPFGPWGELVSYGIWPIGPVGSRLLVGIDNPSRPWGPKPATPATLSS